MKQVYTQITDAGHIEEYAGINWSLIRIEWNKHLVFIIKASVR